MKTRKTKTTRTADLSGAANEWMLWQGISSLVSLVFQVLSHV